MVAAAFWFLRIQRTLVMRRSCDWKIKNHWWLNGLSSSCAGGLLTDWLMACEKMLFSENAWYGSPKWPADFWPIEAPVISSLDCRDCHLFQKVIKFIYFRFLTAVIVAAKNADPSMVTIIFVACLLGAFSLSPKHDLFCSDVSINIRPPILTLSCILWKRRTRPSPSHCLVARFQPWIRNGCYICFVEPCPWQCSVLLHGFVSADHKQLFPLAVLFNLSMLAVRNTERFYLQRSMQHRMVENYFSLFFLFISRCQTIPAQPAPNDSDFGHRLFWFNVLPSIVSSMCNLFEIILPIFGKVTGHSAWGGLFC